MKKRVLSLFLAITLCLSLTPTGALAEESLPEQTVVATQETETPTPAPQKEEPQPEQTAAATQETETPTPVPQKEEPLPEQTAAATQETETPTPAPQKEEPQPEQTVAATQETETPTPAPQKEEPTAPAENGAGENASPANPEENPTENTPAAAEKNSADEEPGKEPAAATGRDESKADGSPSDDDAAKVQNRLVMAAAAEQNEPTMEGKNELPTLKDAGQDGEGGGIYVAPGSPTEGGGGIYVSEGDTRTEIWCTSGPSSIQRGYDGTADGSTIPINLTFTDGTNEIKLKEGTGFTATKTFDSADAGWRTVTVEIELIGDAAAKYKLKEGEETFTIDGYINKAHPELTVSLSKTACTAGEKLLPLLSVEGAPDGAAVTYYYLASALKSWAGSSDVEGSDAMPKIDENTAISEPGTYYVYAKTGETTNYEEERSTTAELTVIEAVVEAASVTKADGTVSGTYTTLPAALDAAQDGDTVKLLADHTTKWSDVEAGEYATLAVVKKTLTLDLNGMTVDYLTVGDVVPDEAGGILDSYDGNLTVVDNIQGGSCGKIENLEFVQGSLAIRGGRIGDSLTCDRNSGTVTISGGTVCNATVGDGATVTVTGGTGHAGTWYNDGTLNITGGTFGNVEFLNNGGTIAISGGTFGKITNINGSGSIPLMPLLADNCAFYQGDNAQNSTEVTLTNVTVKPHTHSFENGKCGCGVASIVVDNNNSCYSTLQAALDAAANDATITSVTLGQDLTEDVMFSGSAAGSLTLNMNGHKLETTAGAPLTVTGGELIIEGAGQINQNTASNANPFPAISLTGGKLVIAGDLTAQGGYDSSSGRKPAIYATDGELDLQGNVSLNGGLTITGTAKLTNPLTQGTFYVDDSETGYAIAITASDNYNKALELLAKDHAFYTADDRLADAGGSRLRTGTYTIKSHTCSYTHNETNGMAFCNCGRWHAHKNQSEETSVLVNGICPICGYHCPHKNIGNDGVCTDCNAKMVAKVTVGETTTYTADLADALNKAANGTTITLLADTEISAYVNIYAETATGADQMVVTLDLADHTVTSNYKPIMIGADRNGAGSYYGTLKIVGTGNITLDSVTLDTREKGVLDLTGWTGGSISSVTVTKIGNTNEGTLIVGKDAGHIGRLAFAFINCSSAEITNTKLYGGSYDEIIPIGNGTLSLAGLLPNGYAFKNTDGSFAKATESKLFHVTVSECDHGGAEGFDNNSTTCPYCGAPAVAETALNNSEGRFLQRRFADLQTAIDADRAGGAEFRLLTDVTGDYTINGTQNTALDLNGHSIKGTVTVKGTKGDYITTTLSNTENTTTASIDKVVAYDGAELAGSGYPAVIGELTLAEGAKWNNILNGTALGYKVLNADGTHKWYARDDVKGSQLNNVIINRLPITSKTLNLKVDGKNLTGSSPKVERGTTVQLCASCNAKDADVYIYTGEIVGNNEPTYSPKKAEYQKIGTTWYYVVNLDANTIGTYDIYFTASKDGYSVTSSHKKLTVTKPDLRNAVITFRNNSNESTYEPYRSTTTAPGFTVTYNGKTLKLGVDYTASGTASPDGVSTQTLTIKAVEGSDYIGSKDAEWRIVPHKAKVEVGDVIKAYDGTTDLPDGKISLVSAAGSAGYQAGLSLPLSEGDGFELTDAKYDSANASETEKNISFTVKLTDTNYTFEDGTKEKAFTLKGSETDKTFQINKATIASDPQLYQTVFNDLAKTYEINLNQALDDILPEGGTYGDIKYGQPRVFMDSDYYPAGGATIKNGKLSLSINKAASSNQGDEIGTVAVQVETTNYQPFTLTIHVIAKNKIVPVMAEGNTVSATDITYGQKLADSKLAVNGTMKDPNTREEVKGTFAWTDDTIKPAAGDYEAEWTFTPAAGYEKYATATGTVTVKVKPAKLTVSVEASSMYYTGEEQIASIIASGQSVDSTPVTFTYSTTENGIYTSEVPAFTDAGKYTVYYKAEAANHEPATGTFTVTIKPMELLRFVSTPSVTKTYDGTAVAPLSEDAVTFNSRNASNLSLPTGAYSITNARFTMKQTDESYADSPEVGNGKSLSFTVTLTSDNYVFESTTEDSKTIVCDISTDDANRFTITKAAAPTNIPSGTLNIINGTYQTYTYDFAQLLPELSVGEYGTVSYGNQPAISVVPQSGYYYDETIVEFKNGVLTLAQFYAKDGTMTGQIGTVKVTVTTTNYNNFQLTLVLNAVNQIKPTPDGTISASEITYGKTLADSTLTVNGTMKDPNTREEVKGTFAWTNPSTKPNKAGDYQAEWTFTPAEGYEKYATVTGTVTVKVNKATPTFIVPTAPHPSRSTCQEQALIIAGSTQDGTMKYRLGESGEFVDSIPNGKDAGSYTVYYKVVGDENHNDTEPASVPVSIGKKPLPITGVTAESKPYDGTTNADITSVTFDNVILNRDTDYTVTASFKDAGVGNGKDITATVTLMDQAAKNYFLEQSSIRTTGSITAKEVTVTITPNGGTYGSVTAATATLSGVVDGETVPVTLTYTGNGYNSTNVPTDVDSYKVTASIADNNYILTGKTIANFVITPKAVTVSGITAKDKAYDGNTAAELVFSNAKFDGILENDTLTVTAKGVFVKTEAGKRNVAISDLTLGGKSAANYVLATDGQQTTTTATITKKQITVTITSNGGIYGETITPATVKANDVVGEDTPTITLTYTGTANDGTEYTGTTPPAKAGTYTVTATTTNHNYTLDPDTNTAEFAIKPKSIKDAKVVLGKGLIANGAEQTQTVEKVLLGDKELPADSYTVTDNTATAPGKYTLTVTAQGNYTDFVEQTYAIAPAKAEDAPGEEITIGSGKVNVDVQSEGAVPPAALLTDKTELLAMLVDSGDITAEELAQIADGASVDIVLTVKEANVSDEVKAAMAQTAKGSTIGHYLDISLFKYMTVNGIQQADALHTTRDALTISIVVPDALINTNSAVIRTYYIVRSHEGTITVLDAAFDAANKTLTFKTDRFSEYAIAYKDTAVPGSSSKPGSNNSSNDSETKKNEVAASTPTPTPTPASTSKPSTITAMPQTGDTFNPTLYVVLLVASLLGLAVVFVCKRRNSK